MLPFVNFKTSKKNEIFIIDVCDFRLLKKFDFPSMKFSLYFMGYEDPADIPADETERTRWVFNQRATLELTQYVQILLERSNIALNL